MVKRGRRQYKTLSEVIIWFIYGRPEWSVRDYSGELAGACFKIINREAIPQCHRERRTSCATKINACIKKQTKPAQSVVFLPSLPPLSLVQWTRCCLNLYLSRGGVWVYFIYLYYNIGFFERICIMFCTAFCFSSIHFLT